jgi:large subunit ribosomal protein L25
MSEIMKVVLEAREGKGKEACSKLRPAGYVPCVVYGPEYRESVPAKVKVSDISKIAASGTGRLRPCFSPSPAARRRWGS